MVAESAPANSPDYLRMMAQIAFSAFVSGWLTDGCLSNRKEIDDRKDLRAHSERRKKLFQVAYDEFKEAAN